MQTDSYWRGRVTRRRALGSGAAGLTALALAACGGSNNKTNGNTNASAATRTATSAATSSAATAATAKTATAAAAGSPVAGGSPAAGGAAAVAPTPGVNSSFKTGGTIQLAVVVNPPLDPYENATYSAQVAVGYVYSRLFKFNAGADINITLSREPVGDLVTGYEVTPDGLTYTMKLRTDAMFHPPLNRPLTSADVTASWQRFTTDPKNTNSNTFNAVVDSLSAPDANTIVYKLKAPYAPFLNKLANGQYFWVMSQDVVAGKIDPSQQVIGTGPWMLDSKTATAINYKKNPSYFIKGIPYADACVNNVIPDTSTQEAQFAAGAIDVLAIPVSDIDSMKKQVPKATVVQYVPNGLAFIFFSSVTDPNSAFHDPRMRQAASLGLDRDGLINLIYSGKGQWDNLINPGLGSWYLDPKGPNQGDSAKWFKHDPAQAKQLIAAAGHTDTQFKFMYPNNAYGDVYNSAADTIRGMLGDAGFNLTVVTLDYLKDYINNGQGIFFKGAPANTIVPALQTPFTDPDDYLFNMLSPQSQRNEDGVNDADLNSVIAAQRVELDSNKRHQLVWQAQQMQDTAMYYPPVVAGSTIVFVQPWVQGYFVADGYGLGTESVAYIALNK